MLNDFADITFGTALGLDLTSSLETFTDSIGSLDTSDYYRSTPSGSSSFNSSLNGISTSAESIYTTLEAGTYYVPVSPGTDALTNYNLNLSATPEQEATPPQSWDALTALGDTTFETGVFTVGQTGEISFDFLLDGGKYQGELAIFSLEGMEQFEAGAHEFIAEAARRALSGSQLGHVVISDPTEGARFHGSFPGESDWNFGDYQGLKTFSMRPGDEFGIILVPNGTVQEVFDNPTVDGVARPLFSLATANPNDAFHGGQIADVVGDGKTFAMEDLQVDGFSDKDYNDFIFQVRGATATGSTVLLDRVIDPAHDWRGTDLGQALIDYVTSAEPKDLRVRTDMLYNPGETVQVPGLVYDADGARDIARVDFWLQQDGGEWTDISDVTDFTPDRRDELWARFSYNLSGLEAGHYQLRAIAYDKAGAVSNTEVQSFTVLSLPDGYELSDSVKAAIEQAANLDSYDPEKLAATRQWVVSVQVGQSSQELAALVGAEDLGATGHIPNTYIWEFSESTEPDQVAEQLGSIKSVEFAYPLVPVDVELLSTPNDPRFQNQWYLHNTGQTGGSPDADANVLPAWNDYSITGKGVVIGIVDDGLQYNHPDLADRYRDDLSWDFTDNDANPLPNSKTTFEANLSEPNITDDGIKLTLPVNLTGLVTNVNVNLELTSSLPEDLAVFLYSPEELAFDPLNRRRHRSPRRFPGVDDLTSQTWDELVIRADGTVEVDVSMFKNKYAGGNWTLEIQDVFDNYTQEQLTELSETLLDSLSLELSTVNPHGTAVAGVAAAAGNNGEGGIGVAYEAELAGLRLIGDTDPISDPTGLQIADALAYQSQEIDIYNNSWRPEDITGQPLALAALETGSEKGRSDPDDFDNPLGNIYVFAAGNNGDGEEGGNVNYNGLANSRHSIAVAAIDHTNTQTNYSTPGASLLVSAYSDNGTEDPDSFFGITTTDLMGANGYTRNRYNDTFGGTSASAALVSGVIALMLEANPNLTLRDVQHILVETAKKIDEDDDGWSRNGAGYWVNHKYGFGAIDAKAAVEKALGWQSVGTEDELEKVTSGLLLPLDPTIPDTNSEGVSEGVEDSILINEDITLEWVEVELDAEHDYRGDLEVVLIHTYTDPETGQLKETESVLAKTRYDEGDDYTSWVFTSARHWGESSQGEWTLQVKDLYDDQSNTDGEWNSWKLNFYGTEPVPEPTVDFTVIDAKAGEDGNAGQILVTRTGNLGKDLTVNYTLAGTATSGTDYDALSGNITIPSGESEVTIDLTPINDNELEGDETVVLNLTPGIGYKLGNDSSGTVSIADDEIANDSHSFGWTWKFFFSEDLNRQGDAVRVTSNAGSTRDLFLSQLSDFETEDFEDFANGSTPSTLTFGNQTASTSGNSEIHSVPTGTLSGAFPMSGDKLLLHSSDEEYRIDFDTPQSAIGFYATDVGDNRGQLLLTLHREDGSTTHLVTPNTFGDYPGYESFYGSTFYYGLVDYSAPFTGVTLSNWSEEDEFAIDDLTIGQVKPEAIANSLTPPNSTQQFQFYKEDTPLDLANLVVSDADGETTVRLTLSDATAGILTTGTSNGVTSTYDVATGILQASGAVADVNALLAEVQFIPTDNSSSSDVKITLEVTYDVAEQMEGAIFLKGIGVNEDNNLLPNGRTERISIASNSTQGNFDSYSPSISADGRYVAFSSDASNLVAGDTNGVVDIFVHDRVTGQTTRVSVASNGTQGNGSSSYDPSISADGRYVAFSSSATNLVAGDTNGQSDLFVHDRVTGQTTRVSPQGNSFNPSISNDGRYVAFKSTSVAGNVDTGIFLEDHVFIHDRQTGQTTRVTDGTQGSVNTGDLSISADGRYVVFDSLAVGLVTGDTNGQSDIFMYDQVTGQTTRVSVASNGIQGNGSSYQPSISADGRYIAFTSWSTNLVAEGETNGFDNDIFVHDRVTGETTRVSVASDGTQGNDYSSYPSISADGRHVAFRSNATNLVVGDTNGVVDVFVHDRQTEQTTRVSVDNNGTQGNSFSDGASISADGRYVAFSSPATNLVAGDTNGRQDIFVHKQW